MNFKTRVWLSSETWIEKYKTYIYIYIYIYKTLRGYGVGRNLELHKHWTRLKIALN